MKGDDRHHFPGGLPPTSCPNSCGSIAPAENPLPTSARMPFLTTPAHMSSLLPSLLWDLLTSCIWAWAAPDCQLITSAYSHLLN